MAAPDLDFLPPSPFARWWGHGVLALGIAACVFAGLRYAQADAARDAALARLQPQQATAHDTPTVPRELQADLDAAHRVAAQLALPWEAWFHALESVSVPGVSLTALQPEAGGRRVRIVGQAGELAPALAYVDALERADGFHQVLLVEHAVQEGAVPPQLRFTLTAEWEAR